MGMRHAIGRQLFGRYLFGPMVCGAVILAGCTASPERVDSSMPASSASAADRSSELPQAVAIDLGALPLGEPPGVGYFVGDIYTGRDGRRTRLSGGRRIGRGLMISYVRSRAGFLVAHTPFEGSVGLRRYDARGRFVGELPGCHGQPAVDGSGDRVAWTTYTCPETGEPGPPTTLHLGRLDDAVEQRVGQFQPTVAGVVDDEVVYTAGFGNGAFVSDLRRPPRAISGLAGAGAVAADGGLVAGVVDSNASRSAVVDLASNRRLWRRSGHPIRFSPSGRLLLLGPGGPGAPSLVVGSRTGEVLARLSLAERLGQTGDPIWEDDEHLLAMVSRHGYKESMVVRIGLDGSVERATDWLRGASPAQPFDVRP